MLQSKSKKKIYFYFLSFLFITTITNQKLFKLINETFLIKEIQINSNNLAIDKEIYSKTKNLINANIFWLKSNIVLDSLKDLNYLENINIQRKFPSKLLIKANKTKLLASTYFDQKKYFVGENGEFVLASKTSNNINLPIIFGKFKISDYLFLQNMLLKYNINLSEINKYYFHKNRRWDLYFNNNILIKLPNENLSKSLELYSKFILINKIKPNSIIDLRINNRLILTDD